MDHQAEASRRAASGTDPTFRFCPRCATPFVHSDMLGAPPTCARCGFVHFLDPKLVAVVVVEHEGKILLGRRNIEPARGMWSFLGGYVSRGEKVEDAAVREVREEANVRVALEGLLNLYSEQDNPHVLAVYGARVIDDDISGLVAQPDEVSELAFVRLQDMPELAFPIDKQILRDWASWRDHAVDGSLVPGQ